LLFDQKKKSRVHKKCTLQYFFHSSGQRLFQGKIKSSQSALLSQMRANVDGETNPNIVEQLFVGDCFGFILHL